MGSIKIVIDGALSALLIAAGSLLFATSAHATVVDLTTGPGANGTIGDALFFATDQQAGGTGFIHPFLRVQASPTEQGYNTDGGFPFDDKNPHNFQHSVLLSSLMQFNLNGTEYFKFTLDANQSGASNHTFTMTQLQIYTANSGSLLPTSLNADGTIALGSLVYNMNAGGTTNTVVTTATGSGKYDAVVYVPVSLFNLSDKFVYLFVACHGNGRFVESFSAVEVKASPGERTFLPMSGLLATGSSTLRVRL